MPTGKQNIQGSYYNGKIYVPGGYIGSHIDENAIYDIASNTWTTGAPEPAPRSGATAAYNGKIYVFGGNPGPSAQTLIYNIASDSWTTGADMPVATTYGRAITVGSYMYYAGGIAGTTTNAVFRYDPAADSWATMASMNTARTSEELMTDGTHIFAVNGGDATFFAGVPLNETVEIYDIAANTWTYGNPTVVTSAGPAGGLAGGKLMIMGGVDTASYYDVTQVSTLGGSGNGGGCATSTPSPTPTCAPLRMNISGGVVAAANSTHKAPANAAASVRAASGTNHSTSAKAVAPNDPITFQLDDGSSENSIGFGTSSSETAALWLNRFTPPAGSYPLTLNSVQIFWPTSPQGPLTGLAVKILVYFDANGDGDPSDAVKVSESDGTISGEGAFQTFPISAAVAGPSGDIYIGFEDFWAEPGYTPKLYPAAIDTDASQGRSWVIAMGSGAPPDRDTLSNNDVIGTIDSFGLPGNWMIRASGDTGAGGGCPASSTPTNTTVPTSTNTPGGPTETSTTVPSDTPTITETPGGPTDTPTATPTLCAITFTDVPPDYPFYEYIRCLYCRGAISGYADNTFRPGNFTSRGQVTKIVVLAFGYDIYIPTSPTFTDVPTDHPFYQYVETAAHNNIVSGYADGTFRPYNNVTRGQLSKIVVIGAQWPVINPPTPTFSDVPVDHPFYVYIETAYCHGIISGYAGGIFLPGSNATRGQISKIVCLAVENLTPCDQTPTPTVPESQTTSFLK